MAVLRSADRMRPYSRGVPILVGLLLLVAAVLKADGFLLEEKLHDGVLGSRVFLVTVIAGEFFLAAWLLSGMAAVRCREAMMGLFGLFSLVTLIKALSGAASCGCFGRLQVNPWWTFLLDLSVVALLWLARPTEDAVNAAQPSPGKIPRARPVLATTLCLLVAAAAMGRIIGSGTAADEAEGVIAGPGKLIILEPEKWIGKPLPVGADIDIGDQLAHGRWTVLLFHHGCPKCREALPRYERLAHRRAGDPDAPQVALVEMPPLGPMDPTNGVTAATTGRLSDRREWFVEAPLEIVLERGIVVDVSTELPSLASGGGTLAGLLAAKRGIDEHGPVRRPSGVHSDSSVPFPFADRISPSIVDRAVFGRQKRRPKRGGVEEVCSLPSHTD